jgi:integrase
LLFGYAYNNFWIDETQYNRMFVVRNSRLDMPQITQEDKEDYDDVKVYTPKEIKLLDSVFSRGNCYTAFLLGYYCGLRISEFFGLMIDDINVIDKTIVVNKQMLYQDGNFCLCPVKMLQSVRVIDVPDILNVHLKEKIFYYLANHSKDSYRDYDIVIDKTKKPHSKIVSGAFINRKENCELLTTNSIKYWSKVIKEELGIDFLFHSLRKTHATMMANANTPVQELMTRLGHKKYETTMAYYIDNNSLARDILKKNINGLDYSDVVINEPGEDPFE